MSCKFCTPTILENGCVYSDKNDLGDSEAYTYYYEKDGEAEFHFSINNGWDAFGVDIHPKTSFRYCPFCGDEYNADEFKRVLHHEQIRTLLETMLILADRKENFEKELAIYRELGGTEKPWFDNLKKGK